MRVGVYGLGNVLMADDALGPYVIRRLESEYEFPEPVTIADLGTPGLDLIPFLIELDAVVFIDTVRAVGNPGDIRVYALDAMLRQSLAPRVTPHDPGVKSALQALRFAGLGPRDVTLVGVIPECTVARAGLSAAVQAAVPAAIAETLHALSALGIDAWRRETPSLSAPWWEDQGATTLTSFDGELTPPALAATTRT